MTVVVVESPAKAKTINKYLGPDFTVLASYGHVRDLPAKDGSVRHRRRLRHVWEVDAIRQRRSDIAPPSGRHRRAWRPTPTRGRGDSGQCEVSRRRALKGRRCARVFNAITRKSVLEAMQHRAIANRLSR